MEVKTEADSNDITECSHDDRPTIGMFCFSAFVHLFLFGFLHIVITRKVESLSRKWYFNKFVVASVVILLG